MRRPRTLRFAAVAAWGLLLAEIGAAHEVSNELDSAGFLADMRRSNEVDSDHRTIMTPEFRQFCITAREHTLCFMAYLFLFVCSYVASRRACLRALHKSTDTKEKAFAGGKRRRYARHLETPYSRAFRARQISLIICSAGLASAAMTGVLMAATVALANAMEHGDPQALGSWRTWLLPSTLLNPGDGSSMLTVGGAHAAHDFPPVLRRLWVYQSVVSVVTAAFLVPVGLLFERTMRGAATAPRLGVALLRWALLAALIVAAWEVASQRSELLQALGFYRLLSHSGATVRYSVYQAASIFGALPTVLAVVPRGTWALFSWLQSIVGQKHEIAHIARVRYAQLKVEQQHIEAKLQRAIGSWKWERVQGTDNAWIVDSHSDDNDDKEWIPKPGPRGSMRSSNSTIAAAELPPVHPGLSQSASATRLRQLSARVTSMRGPRRQLRPLVEPSASTSSLISYLSDELCSSDDSQDGISIGRAARVAQARRQRERESEMQRLSRQIKKYHAQIVFVRAELSRMDQSDLGGDATSTIQAAEDRAGGRRVLVALASGASSVLVLVTASLCWLLVVLQVGRGALSAIFVGEPGLTHGSSHFVPAQVTVSPTVSACQVVAAMSLFVVVMFGVVSVEPVDPLRLLNGSWFGMLGLPRSRQWQWAPLALLGSNVIAAVDPRPGTVQLSGAEAGPVDGNTARVFFSSSADLTSYYRELQSQPLTSVWPMAPAALQRGGTLPESLFQARGWGRQVFLLWQTSGARPVSTQQLLVYTWLVCGLAMTWPSVLRTAGLISERAYVLPVVALAQPLWPLPEHAAVVADDDHQPLLVLQPDAVRSALQQSVVWSQPAVSEVCPASSNLAASFGFEFGPSTCDVEAAKECWQNSTATTGSVPEIGTDRFGADLGLYKTAVANTSVPEPIERRVSRRMLLDSLKADTVPRMLARWGVAGTAHLSPHASIVLSYAMWWAFPDLIVPVSAATVDLQLGYVMPTPLPASDPLLSFGATSAHSEWYGVLRRLERQRAWLPQADDGTPLVLQPATLPLSQPQPRPQTAAPLPKLGRWSALASRIKHGLHALAVRFYSAGMSLLRQLWILAQQSAGAASKVAGHWIQGTYVDTALTAGAQRVAGAALACASAMELAVAWVKDRLSSIMLLVASAGPGSMRTPVPLPRAAEPLASLGVATTVPSVLLPEYWAAILARGGPALQRLRPHLWPHVYAELHHTSVLALYVYNSAPLPVLQVEPTLTHDGAVNSSSSSSSTGSSNLSGLPPQTVVAVPTANAKTTKPGPVSPLGLADEGRQVWTPLDWLLAAYRVVLGLLACRAIFGPSRSPSNFLF